ncbi:DUF2283 domain-containing protein [Candidatus Methanodesulfokora washburnensis]|jgi:uncharacterized protein YuzE|uniref:DUF2283 domain-containing protein n=1 Tax=Candidatus Methanodesulfokora washburnensis TaxID=2478471 RepID=A0A3R9PKF8_9CREN|nr:DUF2283 domain-containing protein [Candidatus Methanodesulfokores washburnensis]
MSKELKVVYDSEADVLVIKAGDDKPSYGEELTDQVIIHFNERGEPIEIEVLDAMEFLAKLVKTVENSKRAKLRTDPEV